MLGMDSRINWDIQYQIDVCLYTVDENPGSMSGGRVLLQTLWGMVWC